MEWFYILGFFFLIGILKFIINFYKCRRLRSLHDKYNKHLQTKDSSFLEYKQEIISLFKDAGVKDSSVIHQEHYGFGNIKNIHISVFDNIANNREDIVNIIEMRFNEASGVFKKRYKDSYNPIFWIELIVKFPQYFLEFLGILPEKTIVKILLILYWIIGSLLGLEKFDLINIFNL